MCGIALLAVMSVWKGVAVTPGIVLFTCEQTDEKTEKPVVANVKRFRAQEPAYWVRPLGLSRNVHDGKFAVNFCADVEHQVWKKAEPALKDGEARTFTMPDGRKVDFRYSSEEPSPAIKIDQLGYAPEALEKFAYVGQWMGLAGELKLEIDGFALVEENSGKRVLEGNAKLRRADSRCSDDELACWTGERPWELDFSKVVTPGRYHLEVDGVGRSDSFAIGHETLMKAFEVHMAGMKRQRCGEKCHRYAYRGDFAPNCDHYGRGETGRKYGFFDSSGQRMRVNHFDLIGGNRKLWKKLAEKDPSRKVRVDGGWHDAADYDRRPQHLAAVGDLAAIAMLQPGCAAAADEAYWGLRHLVAAQQPDGGVGTWIETIRHPEIGHGPTSEPEDFDYFIARPTRDSTMEFSAYAAMTAMALKEDDARRTILTNAAIRAWKYAIDPANGGGWQVKYRGEDITYRQNPELASEFLLKASFDLSILTGDDDFLKPVIDDIERISSDIAKGNWRWSPFLLIELDVHERRLDRELRLIYKSHREALVQEADQLLWRLENSWGYRIPWHPASSLNAKALGWGYALPLSRARWFIAAYSITWKEKYLAAAYLANDFHNGANPDGETLTSGLGIRPTRRFLDLEGRYPAGITPFRLTYGLPMNCVEYCFPDGIWHIWPIWRRYCNFEYKSVENSEFSVWETIAPAAAVTGYLAYREERE